MSTLEAWPERNAPPAVRDLYQERIDRGECAWCDEPATVTVSFEDCSHATPTCAEHFDEYFEYVGWEWLREASDIGPECPDCAG